MAHGDTNNISMISEVLQCDMQAHFLYIVLLDYALLKTLVNNITVALLLLKDHITQQFKLEHSCMKRTLQSSVTQVIRQKMYLITSKRIY